jgi:hypothetical protein
MTPTEASTILRAHNRWRRDNDGAVPMGDMGELGRALDAACAHLDAMAGAVPPSLSADQLKVMLAWEAAELSEGQVAKALGMHRVCARDMRLAAIADGIELATNAIAPVRKAGAS